MCYCSRLLDCLRIFIREMTARINNELSKGTTLTNRNIATHIRKSLRMGQRKWKIWLPWWKSSIEHLQIIHIFEYEPLTFIVGIINMELAFNFYSTLQPQAVSWLLSPDYTERYNAVMWKLQGAIAPYWEKPGALLSSGLLQFFLLSDWLSIDSAILSNVWIITIAAFIWNMVRIKVILN